MVHEINELSMHQILFHKVNIIIPNRRIIDALSVHRSHTLSINYKMTHHHWCKAKNIERFKDKYKQLYFKKININYIY